MPTLVPKSPENKPWDEEIPVKQSKIRAMREYAASGLEGDVPPLDALEAILMLLDALQ